MFITSYINEFVHIIYIRKICHIIIQLYGTVIKEYSAVIEITKKNIQQ